MNILDQWEADEKAFMESRIEYSGDRNIQSKRILALINFVRKKDEALSAFVFDEDIPVIGKSYWLDGWDLKKAREALAVTDELK